MKKTFNPLLPLGFDISDSFNYEIVEWRTGDNKPDIGCIYYIGNFYEGKTHLVRTFNVSGVTYKTIDIINSNLENSIPDNYVIINTNQADSYIYLITLDINSKIWVFRIDYTGSFDQNYRYEFPEGIDASHFVYTGNYSYFDNGAKSAIYRFDNVNGVVDPDYSINEAGNTYYLGTLANNGKIYYSVNGSVIKRLNDDGSLDSSYSLTMPIIPFFELNNYVYCYDENSTKRITDEGVYDSSYYIPKALSAGGSFPVMLDKAYFMVSQNEICSFDLDGANLTSYTHESPIAGILGVVYSDLILALEDGKIVRWLNGTETVLLPHNSTTYRNPMTNLNVGLLIATYPLLVIKFDFSIVALKDLLSKKTDFIADIITTLSDHESRITALENP